MFSNTWGKYFLLGHRWYILLIFSFFFFVTKHSWVRGRSLVRVVKDSNSMKQCETNERLANRSLSMSERILEIQSTRRCPGDRYSLALARGSYRHEGEGVVLAGQ